MSETTDAPKPLTDDQYRELHRALCLAHDPSMTDDEIIEEWNFRSPEDPWFRN